MDMLKPKRLNAIFYGFTTLVAINFLISLSYSSTSYISSSFLAKFLTSETVSILFSLSAGITIFVLAFAPALISYVGLRSLVILIVPTLQLSILLLGLSQNAVQVSIFFVIQSSIIFLLMYIMDLYVEKVTKRESETGNTRGIFLTSGNIAIFLSPLMIGLFVIGEFYTPLYAIGALALAPVFLFSITTLKHITPRVPLKGLLIKTIKDVLCCERSILYVTGASLLLNMFYAWVIVYAPLTLIQVGGYSWQTIGVITAFALLPYLFLEIPLGWLADRYFGETEIMAIGFGIIAVSLVGIAFIPLSHLLLWSIPFFTSRVGAAMIEVSTESYFFKQVNETNSSLVSFFRIMRPAGFLIGPMIALLFLPMTGLQLVFAVFGAILLSGIPLSLSIWDTK